MDKSPRASRPLKSPAPRPAFGLGRGSPHGLALMALVLGALAACGGGQADGAAAPAGAAQAFAAQAGTAAVPSDRLQALAAATPQAAVAGTVTAEHLFLWAQATYPALFPDSPPIATVDHQGRRYAVRAYSNGNHLGVSDDQVYGLGPFTNGVLESFGSLTNFANPVCGRVTCGTSRFAQGTVDHTVTVGTPSTTAITYTDVPGQAMHDLNFAGLLEGDASALNNSTIHLVIDDPLGLFTTNGSTRPIRFFRRDAGWGYVFPLRTNTLERIGRFVDKLTVYACLDAQCARRLAGTPVTIPYDVTVTPGVTLSRTKLEVTVPFGTVPPDEFIDAPRGPLVLSTPYLGSVWEFWTMEEYFSIGVVGADGTVVPSGSGDRLRVQFRPLPVGTYRGKAMISASVKLPGWHPELTTVHQQGLDIIYTVTP